MSDNDSNLPLPDLEGGAMPDPVGFDTESGPVSRGAADLEAVFDVPVKVSAVLGRARMEVGEMLKLGPGAVLGERAVLEGGKRTSTVQAVTDVKVAVASPDQIDRAALEAVSRWRYEPRVVDGTVIDQRVQARLPGVVRVTRVVLAEDTTLSATYEPA